MTTDETALEICAEYANVRAMSMAENNTSDSILATLRARLRERDGARETVLTDKKQGGPLQFGFSYRGIPFVVRALANDLGTDVSIVASLGTLPYSAEDPERRATALTIIQAAARDLGGRIRLSDKQRIELVEAEHLDVPLTPSVLLTRTARLVLGAKPYLELLALVVRPPVGGVEPT